MYADCLHKTADTLAGRESGECGGLGAIFFSVKMSEANQSKEEDKDKASVALYVGFEGWVFKLLVEFPASKQLKNT